MDNIKIFTNTEKELETLIETVRIYSQDIQMEIEIEKCTILIMKKKRKKRNNWSNIL